MAANFNATFWNDNGRNLRRPDLACLRQDSLNYKTLLLQVNGEIGFDDTGIWLTDTEVAESKFNNFFDIAIDQAVELAVTPEYSCPWNCICTLFNENKFPLGDKVWIIGCQSICPADLKSIISEHPAYVWIYDEPLLEQKAATDPKKFFDPVCYLLNTPDNNGELKKVVIVQFKNYPFGGNEAIWERDNLILGNTFYVISNQIESTRLVTLICSDTLDALDFNTLQDSLFINVPLLAVHIQLNQKPFKNSYKSYRDLIFSKGSKDLNKEMICLNWGRNVSYKEQGQQKIFNEYGGSGFYIKSDKLNRADTRINENHNLGLYYASWDVRRAHIYFLNFDEYIYLVENTKPSQITADPTQQNRSGPKMLGAYKWVTDKWTVVIDKICDGFKDVVREAEVGNGDLSCLMASNYVNIERLIELSNGELISDDNWYSVGKLSSFAVGDTEINNRILFNNDPDAATLAVRKRKVINYAILKHGIISNQENLPHGFINASLGLDLHSTGPDRYLINLHSSNARGATGVYLSTATQQQAIKTKEKIANLFKESQQGKMVLVWYEQASGRKREPEVLPTPTIKENVSNTFNSFRKKGKL